VFARIDQFNKAGGGLKVWVIVQQAWILLDWR